MGKIQIFTKEQAIILDELKKSTVIKEQFYFTGGTALSTFYLHHRYSDDLDFFSEQKFDNQVILTLVQNWAENHRFTFSSRFTEVVYIFNLTFPNNIPLKVDFAYYPYKRVEKGSVQDGIAVDSLLDIAINKLLTITQRNDVKDFVDLYFLLGQFTIWDLREGVRVKFQQDLEPFVIASHFLKVEDFDYVPKMTVSFSLTTLKEFFRKQAKEIGAKAVIQ